MNKGWTKYAGFWMLFMMIISSQLFAGDLTINDFSPEVTNSVGEFTTFHLQFTTDPAGDGLPDSGKIRIDFPAGFICDDATVATFNNDINGGLKPEWHQDQTIVFQRDGKGDDVPAGAIVDMSFGLVKLPNTAGTYTVSLETRFHTAQGGGVIDQVSDAGSFEVSAETGNIASFTLTLTSQTQSAGTAFLLSISDAVDSYGSYANGKKVLISSDNANNSPNGQAPVFNEIIIGVDGTGSAYQTLYAAESGVTIKAVAEDGGVTETTSAITVNPNGSLSEIKIMTGATGETTEVDALNLASGDTYTMHCYGYDLYGNGAGDQSATWTLQGDVGSLSPETGVSTELTAGEKGTGSVKAVVGTKSDYTGLIDVTDGDLTIVDFKIRNAPGGGGEEVYLAYTMNADEVLTLYAAGYASGDRYIEDVEVEWNYFGNPNTLASANPVDGVVSTKLVFSPTKGADDSSIKGRIQATYGAADVATGVITVTTGAFAQLKIEDNWQSPHNEIPDQEISVDGSKELYAIGYDSDGNFIGEQDVYWTVSDPTKGDVIPAVAEPSPKATFYPKTVGVTTVRGTSGTTVGNTGIFTITAGAAHHLLITQETGARGGALEDITISTDQTIRLWAAAVDEQDNFVAQASPRWAIIGNLDTTFTLTEGHEYIDFSPKAANRSGKIYIYHPANLFEGDTTGTITVTAGDPHHIRVMTGETGYTELAADLNLLVGESVTFHAAGFDVDDNYTGDISDATWVATNIYGTMDVTGPTLTFTPTKTGTGFLKASKTGLLEGYSGNINVQLGKVHAIKILDRDDEEGVKVSNISATTDEPIVLYAGLFDAGDNFIGTGSGTWYWIPSGLEPEPDSITIGSSLSYEATVAPSTGKFYLKYYDSYNDTTLTDTVDNVDIKSGRPYGVISLTANPKQIPADGTSEVVITSGVIHDRKGNQVSSGTKITVTTTVGVIISKDMDVTVADTQVVVDGSGKISFILQATLDGGIAEVRARGGDANGITTVSISDLSIESVIADVDSTVSREQTGIIVRMVLKNLGDNSVTVTDANLQFKGTGDVDRYSDYDVTLDSELPTLVGGGTGTVRFIVDVLSNANIDSIIVDGKISTDIEGVSVDQAVVHDSWKVQNRAKLQILKVDALADSVAQGKGGLDVSVLVTNNSGPNGATAKVDTLKPTFWLLGTTDVSSQYESVVVGETKIAIAAEETTLVNLKVGVNSGASEGLVTIDAEIFGFDANSGYAIQDKGAELDSTDVWFVEKASQVQIAEFNTSQATVTQNQTSPWYALLVVENNGANTAVLDEIQLEFSQLNKNLSSEYSVTFPNTFVSGVNTLAKESEDTLKIAITKTGLTLGQITMKATIYMEDLGGGGSRLYDEQQAQITVQEPANVELTGLKPSHPGATAGQSRDWYVYAAMNNGGGSDILVDTARVNTYMTFSTGTDFKLKAPYFKTTKNNRLKSGKQDTLIFPVDSTGAQLGTSNISMTVLARDANSGQETSLTGTSSIKIQSEPAIRIAEVVNSASNSPYVNSEQNFNLTIYLDNSGGLTADEVDSVRIKVTSDRQDGVVWEAVFDDIKPLETNACKIQVTAANTPGVTERFSAVILSAIADNTRESITPNSPVDYFDDANIVGPANLSEFTVSMPDTVQAKQNKAWNIHLIFTNTGSAGIKFDKPTKNDISFHYLDVKQTDYVITAPTALNNSESLVLAKNSTDTLTYSVTRTGSQSGKIYVKTVLNPRDQNDPANVFAIDHTDSVFLAAAAKLSISNIEPDCPYIVKPGDQGQVNVGQAFTIKVAVDNYGAEQADSVYVMLVSTDTTYISFKDTAKIASIGISEIGYAEFEAVAKKVTDSDGAYFEAKILSAIGHDSGLRVPVEDSEKYTTIRVHEPTELELLMQTPGDLTAFTKDTDVTIKALFSATGTSAIMSDGKLEIELPDNYTLVSQENTDGFSLDDTPSWVIHTPTEASGESPLTIRMAKVPTDQNTGSPVAVKETSVTKNIRTVESSFRIDSFTTYYPEGAKDGTVSTGQTFDIQGSISYSDDVSDIRPTLKLPEDSTYQLISVNSEKKLENPSVWVWRIKAPESAAANSTFKLEARGTQTADELYDEKSVDVTTVKGTTLRLDLDSEQGDPEDLLEVSIGQVFEINAVVRQTGIGAKPTGEGKISIDLGDTNIELADGEAYEKTFEVDQKITWKLVAPLVKVDRQDLIFEVIALPDDENTGEPASMDEERINVPIKTQEQGILVVGDFTIVSPEGALDHILSTRQTFIVQADVQWERCSKIVPEIVYPENSFICENPPLPIYKEQLGGNVNGSHTFSFTVSTLASIGKDLPLQIVFTGTDANSGVEKKDSTEAVPFEIVERAAPSLYANTDDGNTVVSVGETFEIKAYLITTNGEAGVKGNFTAMLSRTGNDYVIYSDVQQSEAWNNTITWNIQAPIKPNEEGEVFTVKIITEPNDENTNDYVTMKTTQADFRIVTEAKKLYVSTRSNVTPKSISRKNKNLIMMGLIFLDEGGYNSNPLLLQGLKLKLKSHDGLIEDPTKVISRIAAIKHGNLDMVYGQLDPVPNASEINLKFTTNDTIRPQIPDSVDLVVDIAENASILNFRIAIDTTTAINVIDMHSKQSPLFTDSKGAEITSIDLKSDLSVVLDAETEKSFINYPNPFGRGTNEKTKFVYYLEEASDVEIKIYTLLGQLVWSQNFSKDDDEGQAGMHEENFSGDGGRPIYWDGKNNFGHKVLNGVYIAVLSTSTGKKATTKVVYIK